MTEISSISLSGSSNISELSTSVYTLYLDAPAPVGGAIVNLFASPTDIVMVPATISVPEGLNTISFSANASSVNANENFFITAVLGALNASVSGIVSDTDNSGGSPIANDDKYSVTENALLHVSASKGVLGNDQDPGNDGLNPVLVAGPAHGTLKMLVDGSFDYQPDQGYVGTDSFQYSVGDANQISTATVTFKVNESTDNNQTTSTSGGITLVLINGPDIPEGAQLNFVISLDSPAPSGGLQIMLQASGDVNLPVSIFIPTGQTDISFSGTHGSNETDKSFTVTATSASLGVTLSVSGTIESENNAPVASNDKYHATENDLLHVSAGEGVLHNDADSDHDSLTATLVSGPEHGSITLLSDGSFDYRPDAGFTGIDSFTYQANDGQENSSASTVNLLVAAEQPCYCFGTLIETADGDVAVENLAIGDLVCTMSSTLRPIKWIGKRAYAGRFIAMNRNVLPVCFKAGSLGENTPRRDLWVSPHHAMLVDGLLIEAKDLINDTSIYQADEAETDVEYFHIELDSHDVIVAEGAFSETFIDDDSRAMFHNAVEYRALYGDETPVDPIYCAPRVNEGFELEAIRQRLMARAWYCYAAA